MTHDTGSEASNRTPFARRENVRLLLIPFLLGAGVGLVLSLIGLINSRQLPSYLQRATAVMAQTMSYAEAQGIALPTLIPLPTATPYEFVEVVIAVRPIPRGAAVTINDVGIVAWPADFAPIASFSNLEDVIGQIARADISREQPILLYMITDDYNEISAVADYPQLPLDSRGSLSLDTPVTGEINNVVWLERWTYSTEANETITLTMQATSGNLQPFLMIWTDQGEWVEGQRLIQGQTIWVTVTLAEQTALEIHATRARANNGHTAGTYQLDMTTGYTIPTPSAAQPTLTATP